MLFRSRQRKRLPRLLISPRSQLGVVTQDTHLGCHTCTTGLPTTRAPRTMCCRHCTMNPLGSLAGTRHTKPSPHHLHWRQAVQQRVQLAPRHIRQLVTHRAAAAASRAIMRSRYTTHPYHHAHDLFLCHHTSAHSQCTLALQRPMHHLRRQLLGNLQLYTLSCVVKSGTRRQNSSSSICMHSSRPRWPHLHNRGAVVAWKH